MPGSNLKNFCLFQSSLEKFSSVSIKYNVHSLIAAGTGKTLTSSEVSERVGLRPVDVGKVAKEGNLYEGWDELYQCPILDEDKVRR